jgi:glycosyltransferase involved in cell wall biosynthesis
MGTYRRVSIFVPAYNEVLNLEAAIKDIIDVAETVLDDYEVLLVDDGSTDGTRELADRLTDEYQKLRVIHQPRNLGIAAAYTRALDEAKLDYFSFLPADREVSAESISAIFRAVGSADIVVPYHANTWARPWHRRILTASYCGLVNFMFGLKLRYYQGPSIYPTSLARKLSRTDRGFYFPTEMLVHAVRAGHNYVEVGMIHQQRQHGTSKAVSVRNVVKALVTIGRLWWGIRSSGRKR